MALVYKNNGAAVRLGDGVVVNDSLARVTSWILGVVTVKFVDTGRESTHDISEIGAEWRRT